MANHVTRTFAGYNITFLTIDENGDQKQEVMYIAENDREKAVKRATKEMAGKGILLDAERIEEVRAMTVEDFYKLSEPFERPQSQQKKIEG